MDCCWDFIQCLGADVSTRIFVCLDDPSDLARVCSVSSSWRKFVIENRLSKHLCLKLFPEISSITHAIEVDNRIDPVEVMSECSSQWEIMEKDHKIYASLGYGLTSVVRKDCISESISASSTDRFPDESLQNTLVPSDRVDGRASYWSSQGQNDSSVPEIILYKLISKFCVITEVNIQPFQAYFEYGFPIYSARAVRFRMGHSMSLSEAESKSSDESAAVREASNGVVWTYTTPVFPMSQENSLQKFKLPEPVLCIGGIIAVELLGRVQRNEWDGLYYVCISHVQVLGRSLSTEFDVEIIDEMGSCTLKYNPIAEFCFSDKIQSEAIPSSSSFHTLATMLEQILLNTSLGNGGAVVGDDDDEVENDNNTYEDGNLVA